MNIITPSDQESPLKRAFDKFDIEHATWSEDDYKVRALETPVKKTTDLLVDDWNWRYEHKQNIILSAEGDQGSGKSLLLSYGCLLQSSIFKKPFFDPKDIKVLRKHLSFDPEMLASQIENSEGCETFLNDEHRKGKIGMMSNMIGSTVEEYEDQLRKDQDNMNFASPDLQNHTHFFVFETKHIVFGKDGFPISVMAMLKTKRYTNRKEFVWRGLVGFPVPSKAYLEQYDELKTEHLKRLKARYGNTLDPIAYYANKLFEENHKELIKETREGFIKPRKAELIYFIIAREIGTRKFTTGGYSLLQAKLKQLITETYERHNQVIEEKLDAEAEELKEQRRAKFNEQQAEAETKREHRLQILEKKLIEERRKNDLKEKALKLREKELDSRHKGKGK